MNMNMRHAVSRAAPFPRATAGRQDLAAPAMPESPRPRILLVDDDIGDRARVIDYLESCGICVTAISDAQQLGYRLGEARPNLVLLDLAPAAGDELGLLRLIRARSEAAVIVAVGGDRSETDRAAMLEAGADDCLAKPFSLRELLARIRAVLRRQRHTDAAAPRPAERGGYRFGGWRLDLRARRLTDPAGDPVALTRGEYDLLVAFLEAPQRPLTREHLIQATRMHEDCADRNIDVRVVRLRRKLERDPGAPRLIRTERGAGYLLDLPVERVEAGRRAVTAASARS